MDRSDSFASDEDLKDNETVIDITSLVVYYFNCHLLNHQSYPKVQRSVYSCIVLHCSHVLAIDGTHVRLERYGVPYVETFDWDTRLRGLG